MLVHSKGPVTNNGEGVGAAGGGYKTGVEGGGRQFYPY